MNIEQALKIIHEEKLQGYNMNEKRVDKENEVVLRNKEDKWSVYVTDERASKITNSEDSYLNKEEALDDFIERLRADKILREL